MQVRAAFGDAVYDLLGKRRGEFVQEARVEYWLRALPGSVLEEYCLAFWEFERPLLL